MIQGVLLPVITPFDERGRVDEIVLRKLVEFYVDVQVQGLFLLGSSGQGRMVENRDRIRRNVFTITRNEATAGFVVVIEEIGKHRPITFAVGVRADGKVNDLAVLAYREAYGGEIRDRRFLGQYRGKALPDALLPHQDIRNISGATLSVQATGRAARKAIAVLRATGDLQ